MGVKLHWYNENDPFAARWLSNLALFGFVPDGEVDRRSIREISPGDLEGVTSAHFFAGIGGWPLALEMAGWPEDRPVWTGSCPCQPFSVAGKQKGTDDDRHLWPVWYRLIAEHRPPAIFGEQVASPLGRQWLAAVRSDLEELGYAVGAADLCAAGVGAPHIRQRLFWVADAGGNQLGARRTGQPDGGGEAQPPGRGDDGGVGNTGGPGGRRDTGGVPRKEAQGNRERQEARSEPDIAEPSSPNGGLGEFWDPADWILCDDPRGPVWRPAQPGLLPLADGVPGRVGLLRGYGNAVVPQVAATFVRAFTETQTRAWEIPGGP